MTEKTLKLLDTNGFIEAYEEKLRVFPTKQSAFNAVNREHEINFGKPKYSSYDSFRQVRNKKMKRNN